MTILEYMWHIAKYSAFGVKVLVDPFPEPLEIAGINIRSLELETPTGIKVVPREFTKIRLYLYPLSYLKGDDLFRYQVWSKTPKGPESHEKFLERMNNLEYLLCSRHIDYLDFIPRGFAIDSSDLEIYGNME
jgi:hypothetical protein